MKQVEHEQPLFSAPPEGPLSSVSDFMREFGCSDSDSELGSWTLCPNKVPQVSICSSFSYSWIYYPFKSLFNGYNDHLYLCWPTQITISACGTGTKTWICHGWCPQALRRHLVFYSLRFLSVWPLEYRYSLTFLCSIHGLIVLSTVLSRWCSDWKTSLDTLRYVLQSNSLNDSSDWELQLPFPSGYILGLQPLILLGKTFEL